MNSASSGTKTEGLFETTNGRFEGVLTLNDYQDKTGEFATYPRRSLIGLMYNTAQLASEAGEFNGHIAKAVRDEHLFIKDGMFDDDVEPSYYSAGFTEERMLLLKKELGDVLWSVAQAAYELGWTLEEVAQGNLDKLSSRKTRGTLAGSGDNR